MVNFQILLINKIKGGKHMIPSEINQQAKHEIYSDASKQFAESEITALNFSDVERETTVAGACGCCKPSIMQA